MFQPVLAVGAVAKRGGGWVLALLDLKDVHAEQTGLAERNGKEELQVRFLALFVRVRVLGLNEKRAKDGVPMTLVRE